MGVGVRRWAIVISCEHGGNCVPEWLADRFAGAEDVLASHRGWDPGALGIAVEFCMGLGFHRWLARSTHIEARTSRLVVDLNRSERSPTVFSEFTRELPPDQRERILVEHYRPYRTRVEAAVRESIDAGLRVAHVSVHTFTPVLGADRREFDAGILFDPAREPEATIARDWIGAIGGTGEPIDVRANQPYLGTDDGLTTTLRGVFGAEDYIGIEVEVRNDLVQESDEQTAWASRLASSLMRVVAG
jgi:predicted N-formylglutamate amidohydrolase